MVHIVLYLLFNMVLVMFYIFVNTNVYGNVNKFVKIEFSKFAPRIFINNYDILVFQIESQSIELISVLRFSEN